MQTPKDPKELLQQTDEELAEAKRLLKEKNQAVENAINKMERRSAKYSRKTVKVAVEGLKQHRDILKEQTAKGDA
jgi:hypothetical protein